MVQKTHLEPFREPLKVPPVGQPKNPFFLRVYGISFLEGGGGLSSLARIFPLALARKSSGFARILLAFLPENFH